MYWYAMPRMTHSISAQFLPFQAFSLLRLATFIARLLPMTTKRIIPALAGILLATCSICSQAQVWAKTRLDLSPRHHEYVSLKHDSRPLQAFVVYPEIKEKAPVVVLIHEIFGLS